MLAGALLMCACATPIVYGPIDGSKTGFGYSDQTNADGGYTVRVVASSPAQAHEFLDRRAAELCHSSYFRKNIFSAQMAVEQYSGYASGPNGYGGSYTSYRYGAPVLQAYVYCDAATSETAPPVVTDQPAPAESAATSQP
jgi:hypothetical protein